MQNPLEPSNLNNVDEPLGILVPESSSLDQQDAEVPVKRNPTIRRFVRRLFISLVVVGLAIGGLVSWGVVHFLKKMGLTDVPSPEAEQVEK